MEQERRTSGGQRVPFEALVVVANQKGGGAYECEAIDLSETGMHLRTAYLPEKGQRLTFRFDTGAGEVTLEGEVAWCTEEARGGEFGVRFVRIDEATLTAIRETLGLSPENKPRPAELRIHRGARVRLHIDGLNSPMRARVRDDHTGAIQVGSNLDFLQVGKSLELEDVERGKRRGALVDKVEVEVDPNSKIPQLVVTLRYEEGVQEAKGGQQEPIKVTTDSQHSRLEEEEASREKEPDRKVEGEAPEAPAVGSRLKETWAQAGARIAAMSAPAREAVGKFLERLKARREQEVEKHDEKTPVRRVTAPPPNGGIQTSGRRQQHSVMEDPVEQSNPNHDEEINGLEESDEDTLKIRKKQRLLIAAGASLLAVLLVVFGLRARSAPPPGTEASAPLETNTVAPTGHALPAAPGTGSADVVSAHVPLFGATPLTTTEPAPLPAPSASLAASAGTAPRGEEEDKGEEEPGKTEF
ncbi:MAG: PilZ domain-containing protein, partial [Myxococcales bacterium]|nr:PilZ domain-containing protein [Polyangiaceae bacterium]MDW8250366.1 PilZ domain-containing protein [Myxococcales bacterium]